MLLWSSGPGARDYTRGTHEYGSSSLPDGLASRLADPDNNGIPDSVEKMSLVDRQKAYANMTNSVSSAGNNSFVKTNTDG
jgi:hypothetical protein